MAVVVRRTSAGYLAYRLRHRLVPGYQSQERTGLEDTPKNRATVEARARVMSDEMIAGTFKYEQWFPRGSRIHLVEPKTTAPKVVQKIGAYVEGTWLPRQAPPSVRASYAKDVRRHWRRIALRFADVLLDALTPGMLATFRAELLAAGLSYKTSRNTIDSTFRAIHRDARLLDYRTAFGRNVPITEDVFALLTWDPRKMRQGRRIDPFTIEERDALCRYFARKRGGHFYAFVVTAFWTGARPSELLALRWGDVDLRAGTIHIHASRTFHETNGTKTEASIRTLKLAPSLLAVLRQVQPLYADEDAFVFMNLRGRPIFLDTFTAKHWRKALRACGVRPRRFYQTRHTYISLAVSAGTIPLKRVAEDTGTSVAMIEKVCGKYLPRTGDAERLDAALGLPPARVTDGDGVPMRRAKSGRRRAVAGARA